jgi:hypothetical protein
MSTPVPPASDQNQQAKARAKSDSHANDEHRGVHAVAFLGFD